ncbi:MAG: hypothetical protein HS124_07085 [Anaerolineales bacterium]|nr:hypothetical protein [Anaerolineales bacterium]
MAKSTTEKVSLPFQERANKAFSETVMSQERLRGSFEALVRAKSVSEAVKNPKITKAVKCKAGVA